MGLPRGLPVEGFDGLLVVLFSAKFGGKISEIHEIKRSPEILLEPLLEDSPWGDGGCRVAPPNRVRALQSVSTTVLGCSFRKSSRSRYFSALTSSGGRIVVKSFVMAGCSLLASCVGSTGAAISFDWFMLTSCAEFESNNGASSCSWSTPGVTSPLVDSARISVSTFSMLSGSVNGFSSSLALACADPVSARRSSYGTTVPRSGG